VTTNYELDRSIRHVQQGAGNLKRLSVAVVVNYRDASEGGKSATRALTPVELEQIRNLAKEAMGFSQERGDSLNVVNSPFADDNRMQDEARQPFWRDPENLRLARGLAPYLGYGLLALFAWFAVLRPLLRKHLAPTAPPAPAAPQRPEAPAEPDGTPRPSAEEALREREATRRQADMDYALQAATKDPKLVAALIQHWMNANDK